MSHVGLAALVDKPVVRNFRQPALAEQLLTIFLHATTAAASTCESPGLFQWPRCLHLQP